MVNVVDAHFSNSTFPLTHDFIVDASTILVPCVEKISGPIRMLELFAGAYGGWASAVRVLKQQGNHTQIVAVDNDLDACKTYAISHGAALVNGMVAMDSLQFVNSISDFIIHADVKDRRWLRPIVFGLPKSLPFPALALLGRMPLLGQVWIQQKAV